MNEPRDELLEELRALISIEPAPGFEGRVHREVEQQPRWGSKTWRMGAGALAVAATVTALVIGARPAPSPAAPPSVSMAPRLPAPVEASHPAMPVQLRVSSPRTPLRATTTAPEVIVPPDQAIALRQLLAGVRAGQVILAAASGSDDPVVVEPLPDIPPVKIEALPREPADAKGNDSNSSKVEHHDQTQA